MNKKYKSPVIDEFAENPEDVVIPSSTAGESPQEKADGIFERGQDGSYWKGRKLHAFSRERRRAADIMGLRITKLGDGEIKKLQSKDGKTEGEYYDGFDLDAIRVLWSCWAPAHAIYKTLRLPDWGLEQACKFAEDEGIDYGKPAFVPAISFFLQTLNDWLEVQGQTKLAEGKQKKVRKPGN